MNFNRLGSAIVLMLSAVGCNRTEVAPTAPPPTSPLPATSAAPATVEARATTAPTPAPVIKQGKLETVSVNAEPYCRKAAGPGATADAIAAARPIHPWLTQPGLQDKLRVLEEELKPYTSSLIGVTFENEPQTAIVVLYPGFTAYEELQAKLAPRVKPLPVALRPGCHTSQQLAEALTILEGRAWHPKARSTPTGWHLDVASSAYAVVVDDSAPEVAEALQQKLGDRALVRLGKPRRHALDADSAKR